MGSVTVAVIMGDRFDPDNLRAFLESMQTAAGRLVVVLPELVLAESDGVNRSIVFHRVSKDFLRGGPTAMVNGVGEALRASPDAEHVVMVISSLSRLPTASRISEVLKSGLDYTRVSNCIFLSRKYANHVLQTESVPSAVHARKHGLLAASLMSGLIHSPKDAIEESTFIKFAMVGATGVVVNYLVVIIFKLWIPWINILIGDAVGIELSIINNFIWNDMFTFKNSQQLDSADSVQGRVIRFLKYNLVSLVSTSVNLSTFYYLDSVSGVYYLWSLFVAIILAFLINYVGSSRWAWSKGHGNNLLPSLR